MTSDKPIVLVEDDEDDCDILREAFLDLQVKNPLRFFGNGQEVLDYLLVTTEQPFLIVSDINMPRMNGIELCRRINENVYLRKKSIPFVFLTTSRDPSSVKQAYEMMVQGYFQKAQSFTQVKLMVQLILGYWRICLHPNNMR